MNSRAATLAAAMALLAAAGCAGPERHSVVDPAGVQADRIHGLWWLYLAVCVAVYVLVMAAVAVALVRRRGGSDQPLTAPPLAAEVRRGIAVAGCVGLTVVTLFVLLIADFVTGRRIDSLAREGTLTVRVTGHQWWWEVRYEESDPQQQHNAFTTANEIHIPTGRAVRFELESTDVIHSFWVPNLHGKTDMIPGHRTKTDIRADRDGEFWGQCAEFCGHQHANMRLRVIAQPEAEFQKWLAEQRQPARESAPKSSQDRGKGVFMKSSCVLCHTITGTQAGGRVGPDLTHLASRPRIAAGTLENTRGNLAEWVTDPHGIKPGVRMPANPLAPEDLHVLLDYLESLK